MTWRIAKFVLSTNYPAPVGDTYLSHLRFALRFGASMVVGGAACIAERVMPLCLTTCSSRRKRALYDASLAAHFATPHMAEFNVAFAAATLEPSA